MGGFTFLSVSLMALEEIGYAALREPETDFVPHDLEDPRQLKLHTALERISQAAEGLETKARLIIRDSEDVRASYKGTGIYFFSQGMADIPDWAIDGIAAHEVGHAVLNHPEYDTIIDERTELIGDMMNLLALRPRAESWLAGYGLYKLWMSRREKAEELEADDKAIEILRNYGYEDPVGVYRRTLILLFEMHGDSSGEFLDCHPALSFRIRRLVEPISS